MNQTFPTNPPPAVAIDPARCPICGRPNHCLMASGAASNEECWCFRVRFPLELLARVPAAARHRACICQECVNQALAGAVNDAATHSHASAA